MIRSRFGSIPPPSNASRSWPPASARGASGRWCGSPHGDFSPTPTGCPTQIGFFIEHAIRVGGRKRGSDRPVASDAPPRRGNSKEIRAWAAEQGYEISARAYSGRGGAGVPGRPLKLTQGFGG
ncbi:lysyl tRNA synthetase-like protein [Rhodococcus opacus M213]|uniref:Lysyl tRNA synthetase-like protein n=1 Tax=Rhodococcus opacus M213 TaxID=1129896 RepID=K8XIH1_RHOOP|nr:lysyl tRNA synthetase-like protein [Rhodococcus opacus M213]